MKITRCNDSTYGRIELNSSKKMRAGSTEGLIFYYYPGKMGFSKSGKIRILERHASDWGKPQTDNPDKLNYVSAGGGRGCKWKVRYFNDWIGGDFYPWRRITEIELLQGTLSEKEKVIIDWGGEKGFEISRYSTSYPFKIIVDPLGTDTWHILEDGLSIEVIGNVAHNLCITIPSEIYVNIPFNVKLKVEDCYGNPVVNFCGKIYFEKPDGFECPDMIESYNSSSSDKGIHNFQTTLKNCKKDYFSIKGRINNGQLSQSNKAKINTELPKYRLVWGDPHCHSIDGCGMGSLEECYYYARDISGLDYVAISANDAFVTDECWEKFKYFADKFDKEGEFVTFLAFEWHGEAEKGGDHVVCYKNTDEPIFRSGRWAVGINEFLIAGNKKEKVENMDAEDFEDLHRMLKDKSVFLIPHVCGFKADLSRHNKEIEPVVEVWSHHGDYEDFGKDALERGYYVGLVAASDDHSGHPGDAHPLCRDREEVFSLHKVWPGKREMAHGGLTGVYIEGELRRESVFEAFYSRRLIGTTGERIFLDFSVNDFSIGSRIILPDSNVEKRLKINAAGTVQIEKIEIIKNLSIMKSITVRDSVVDFLIKDKSESKDGDFYFIKLYQKDGHRAWSSPIWIKV